MLGKLCKYLRMCGIDTAYANEGSKIAFLALKENRVVLTKNTKLRSRDNVFLLDTDDPMVQLQIVVERFDLKNHMNFLSRCLLCNEPLVKTVKENVKNRIPYYTYQHFDEYEECPKCARIYWKGSHYQKMVENIERDIKLHIKNGKS